MGDHYFSKLWCVPVSLVHKKLIHPDFDLIVLIVQAFGKWCTFINALFKPFVSFNLLKYCEKLTLTCYGSFVLLCLAYDVYCDVFLLA